LEILNDIQEKILRDFGKLSGSERFYLIGGTALSYFYLHHRRSRDLDFFTSDAGLVLPFSRHFEDYLKQAGFDFQRERGLDSFVEFVVRKDNQQTLVQFAQDAAFRFEPVKEFSGYSGLKVDNLKDIASNKMLVLFGRAMLRDFIDIYVLVEKNHFTRNELIDLARKKDPGFDLYWLGVAFERIRNFSSDASDFLMLLEPVDFEKIQEFFNLWRRDISKELK